MLKETYLKHAPKEKEVFEKNFDRLKLANVLMSALSSLRSKHEVASPSYSDLKQFNAILDLYMQKRPRYSVDNPSDRMKLFHEVRTKVLLDSGWQYGKELDTEKWLTPILMPFEFISSESLLELTVVVGIIQAFIYNAEASVCFVMREFERKFESGEFDSNEEAYEKNS